MLGRTIASVLLAFLVAVLSMIFTSTASAQSGFGEKFDKVDVFAKQNNQGSSNPFANIRKVAIVPFFSMSPDVDAREFSRMFTGLVENLPNWEAIYPDLVQMTAMNEGLPLRTPYDALRVGRLLGVDAVIIGEIRNFKAYYPPSITLKVAIYKTQLRDRHQDIVQLSRAGVGNGEKPLKPGQAIWELSATYNGAAKRIKNLVRQYVKRLDEKSLPYKYERYLREKTKFYEAISYIVSQDILREMNKPGETVTTVSYLERDAYATPPARNRDNRREWR